MNKYNKIRNNFQKLNKKIINIKIYQKLIKKSKNNYNSETKLQKKIIKVIFKKLIN